MQAVEHGERQGEGNAVERMVRLEAVAEFEFAVGVFPIGGELLFGNVRGGVLHEVVAGEEQQARVFLLGSFEPGLESADVGEGFGGGCFVLVVVFRQAFNVCRSRFVGFENPPYVCGLIGRCGGVCRFALSPALPHGGGSGLLVELGFVKGFRQAFCLKSN